MNDNEWKSLLNVWLKYKFKNAVNKWKAAETPLTGDYEKKTVSLFRKYRAPKGTE